MATSKRKRTGTFKKGESRHKSSYNRNAVKKSQHELQSEPSAHSDDTDSAEEDLGVKQTLTRQQKLLKAFDISLDKEERHTTRRKPETEVETIHMEDENGQALEDEEDGTDAESDILEGEQESESDGEGRTNPFETHFSSPDLPRLEKRITAIKQKWSSQKVSFVKDQTALLYNPSGLEDDAPLLKVHTPGPSVMKNRLRKARDHLLGGLAEDERVVSKYVFNYGDVFFAGRNHKNSSRLRNISCLHVLNHLFTLRDQILKHNARLAAVKDSHSELEFKDQGFTRPKALFILPTRASCARVVETLVSLAEPEQQENRKRFEDNYVDKESGFDVERPPDYQELFEGNNDDMFRVGVKFTRKTIKFFSQFYNSDIILASPLGLRTAIEANTSKPDFDYLSSIEILVVEQSDALVMQNIDHFTFILERLNQIPTQSHGCDFSRVREWYLDGHAKYLRQTIMLSAFVTFELRYIFMEFMNNHQGKLLYEPKYDHRLYTGLPIKQTFERFESPSMADDAKKRFQYFTGKIVPEIQKLLTMPKPSTSGPGIVLVIPELACWIRVRNYFKFNPVIKSSSFPWAVISENDNPADANVRRIRSHFLDGRVSVLIYTGRAHHFYRYKLRGVRRVIFYQLPYNPIFYEEMVKGWLGASVNAGRVSAEDASVKTVFSKWDALRVEKAVGSGRFKTLCHGKEDGFEYTA